MSRCQLAAFAACASAALAFAAPVAAQSAKPGAHEWEFEITPYLWLAGLKGTTAINSLPQASVDIGAVDVLKNVDFAAAGTFEARKDRWGFFTDLFYAKISVGGTGMVHLTRLGPGVSVNAGLTVKQSLYTFLGEYRVLEGRTPVDLMFGARYNKADMEANVDAVGAGILGIAVGFNPRYARGWWDPVVGVRVVHPIADGWSLMGYVDVGGGGGGGGGSSSKNTYQFIGGANWDYSKSVAVKFGYRYYHVNYDHSGFKYDMDQQGVYAGVGFKF